VQAVQEGRDPPGTIRDEARNQNIVIPAYELDISEEEFKKGMAATSVPR